MFYFSWQFQKTPVFIIAEEDFQNQIIVLKVNTNTHWAWHIDSQIRFSIQKYWNRFWINGWKLFDLGHNIDLFLGHHFD